MAAYKGLDQPIEILKTDINSMSAASLKRYLILLIQAEYRCTGPKQVKHLKPYRSRFKGMRIKTAELYVSKGGKVSTLLYKQCLPTYFNWPGITGLVEHKGFEEYLVCA